MNKRHNNKFNYDPGRLRNGVTILRGTTSEMPDGSVDREYVEYFNARAGEEKINDFNQQQIQAGLSSFRGDKIFVIRYYPWIDIDTSMVLDCNGVRYEILGVTVQDQPSTYIKLACSKLTV